jgi:hypothetical protein
MSTNNAPSLLDAARAAEAILSILSDGSTLGRYDKSACETASVDLRAAIAAEAAKPACKCALLHEASCVTRERVRGTR